MIKKKRKKKPTWRKLYDENWRLCHEIVELRDGKVCIIPGCGATERLDLDHVISRGCKITFFETDILQFICSEHHTHKSFRKGQWVDLTVRDICEARIGKNRFDDLVFTSRKCCPEFATLMHQEKVNSELKRELDALKNERNLNETPVQRL